MFSYRWMYRLGLAPWERRDTAAIWERILGTDTELPPGRALDVGCGRGRDAVYLSKRGWDVTGVEMVEEALAKARALAAEEGVAVHWVRGDVADLGRLGLEPGFTLLYDFGCIQGLPDPARPRAVAGLTELAAPGATLVMFAFRRARRLMLPRGMDESELVGLTGHAWDLVRSEPVEEENMPPPVRRAGPTLYRLVRTAPASVASAAG